MNMQQLWAAALRRVEPLSRNVAPTSRSGPQLRPESGVVYPFIPQDTDLRYIFVATMFVNTVNPQSGLKAHIVLWKLLPNLSLKCLHDE